MQQTYKALADPTRRKILQLLRERDMTAGKIALHFDSAQPTISRHLSILQNADLIQGSKDGTTITYRLNLSVLEEAFMTMLDTFKLDVGGNDEPANPSSD
jgi:DNA-binding transcriptional ArsR family regulator